MNTTLKERIRQAMDGPPKVQGNVLAAYCGCAAASVSDWRSGKSKSIDGKNLTRAAEFLKVRSKWLAEGVGPMRDDVLQQPYVAEPVVQYLPAVKADKMTTELVDLFERLDREGKVECLGFIKGFVLGRSPHTHGQASAVAG